MRSVRIVFLAALVSGAGATLAAQTPPRAQPVSPTAQAPKLPARSLPLTYGTSAVSYIEVPATAFFPYDSGRTYTTSGAWGPRYGTNNGSSGVGFEADVHLPSGAQPVYLELDSIDTNGTASVYASLVECDYFSTGCLNHPLTAGGPGDCQVSGYICSGDANAGGSTANSADLTPDAMTIDNVNRSYRLYAATFAQGGSLQIAGMIVGYILQVSPDPAFATFADVPIGNPYHRFVEALYASGITGGCGSGNFCPNDPLTRGQMAVFLSVALGLQFN